MPNEQSFTSHLFTFDEAMERLYGAERRVLRYAWDIYHHTTYVENERRRELQEENRKQEWSSSRRVSNVRAIFELVGLADQYARPQAMYEESV